VRRYGELIEYLLHKDPSIHAIQMDFEGKNILLYSLGKVVLPQSEPAEVVPHICKGPAEAQHWWRLSNNEQQIKGKRCNCCEEEKEEDHEMGEKGEKEELKRRGARGAHPQVMKKKEKRVNAALGRGGPGEMKNRPVEKEEFFDGLSSIMTGEALT
jgi:hypothetical protein